jgi:hypothetical protein
MFGDAGRVVGPTLIRLNANEVESRSIVLRHLPWWARCVASRIELVSMRPTRRSCTSIEQGKTFHPLRKHGSETDSELSTESSPSA